MLALTASTANSQTLVDPTTGEQPTVELPASVAATMPTSVLDIATYRIAPAPGEPELLVHLWCAPRRNPKGGGGYPPDYYTGEVTREEASHSSILLPSTFVYDIFISDDKGGWNYRNSIFHNATSTPHEIAVQYLNNQTKSGYLFEISGTEGDGSGYSDLRTLYVFIDSDFHSDDYYYESDQVLKRDFSDSIVKHVSGSVRYKLDRDARGYTQIVKPRMDLTVRLLQVSRRARFLSGTNTRAIGKQARPRERNSEPGVHATTIF